MRIARFDRPGPLQIVDGKEYVNFFQFEYPDYVYMEKEQRPRRDEYGRFQAQLTHYRSTRIDRETLQHIQTWGVKEREGWHGEETTQFDDLGWLLMAHRGSVTDCIWRVETPYTILIPARLPRVSKKPVVPA